MLRRSGAPLRVRSEQFNQCELASQTDNVSSLGHMILAEWDSQIGWLAPRIVPYGSIEMNPAATVLHYSSTCFEGMKAFRGSDDKIRLFRPSMNMARFNRSAARVSLPQVDGEALLEIMWKLVEMDQHFIPKYEDLNHLQ